MSQIQKTTAAQLIVQHKDQIAVALPKHVDPDRLSRIALTELRKTPQLADCDPYSFMGALIQCAQLGLEPGSGLGHAYLIPFKRQVQLIVGYQGMIDLTMRSGKVDSIFADIVYDEDDFDYSIENGRQILKHRPNFKAQRSEASIRAVYAVANMKGSDVPLIEVMSIGEVNQIEKQTRKGSGKSNVWVKYFGEMAKKTAIRRLWKKLPKSAELVNVHEYTATEHETLDLRRVAEQYIPELPPSELDDDGKTLDSVFAVSQDGEN
jgi:recombination protein RecT